MNSPLIKSLLVGGSSIIAVGALPSILTTSLKDSRTTGQVSKDTNQTSLAKSSLFDGKITYQNGKWKFKNVCFYYDGKPENKNLKIVGYATGSGVNNYCHSLESAVDKGLPTVRFNVDLSSIKEEKAGERIFAALLLGSEGEDVESAQVLGCIEVSWWLNNKTGESGKGPVVGNSFKKSEIKVGGAGCANDVFKQFNSVSGCKNKGPCKTAWKEVEDKKVGPKKWEDVWVRGSEWKWSEGSKYEKLWTNSAIIIDS